MSDLLIELAQRIAAELGRPVPTPNPSGPTTRARALFVLRDPGATPTSGANETGVLDPFLNRDRSATRTQKLLRAAAIDPTVCVWWNACPYHLGYKGAIRGRDFAVGTASLREFVGICTDLRVVLAMGDAARSVCEAVWAAEREATLPPLILSWHPMTRGSGGAARQAELAAHLRKAALLIER